MKKTYVITVTAETDNHFSKKIVGLEISEGPYNKTVIVWDEIDDPISVPTAAQYIKHELYTDIVTT